MIRPKPARWFEILAARDDATLALEALEAALGKIRAGVGRFAVGRQGQGPKQVCGGSEGDRCFARFGI